MSPYTVSSILGRDNNWLIRCSFCSNVYENNSRAATQSELLKVMNCCLIYLTTRHTPFSIHLLSWGGNMISVSVDLIQTVAYTVRQQVWCYCIMWHACLLTHFCWWSFSCPGRMNSSLNDLNTVRLKIAVDCTIDCSLSCNNVWKRNK